MTTDFWDLARTAPIEPPPEREDLPTGKWLICHTASAENGGWAASVKQQEGKSGPFYKFRIGLACQGGEAGIVKAHAGRYCGFESFIEPGQYDGGNPIAGRLMGFLNSAFSSGVAAEEKDAKARAQERWHNTLAALQAAAEANALDPSAYPNPAIFLATCAKFALDATSHVVLVKTNQRSYEKDGEKKLGPVEAGTVEDYTVANVAKRKVTVLEGEVVEPPAGASAF